MKVVKLLLFPPPRKSLHMTKVLHESTDAMSSSLYLHISTPRCSSTNLQQHTTLTNRLQTNLVISEFDIQLQVAVHNICTLRDMDGLDTYDQDNQTVESDHDDDWNKAGWGWLSACTRLGQYIPLGIQLYCTHIYTTCLRILAELRYI